MSGLYLIGVIALWLWLTSLLWKGIKRLRGRAGKHTTAINVFALILALFWIGTSFWYSGGRKIYYDRQVEKLCAVDGGVKVYETVRLPAERFDEYGNVRIPAKKDAGNKDPYYYDRKITYLRNSDPILTRTTHMIIRQNDGRVMGESIRYARGGGDLPGPWHPSSFICPEISRSNIGIEKSIFSKEGEK